METITLENGVAMPKEGVEALVDCLRAFEAEQAGKEK